MLTLQPHHVVARLLHGDAFRDKGDLAQAILDYSEVLRYHPRNGAAYANVHTQQRPGGEIRGPLGKAGGDDEDDDD